MLKNTFKQEILTNIPHSLIISVRGKMFKKNNLGECQVPAEWDSGGTTLAINGSSKDELKQKYEELVSQIEKWIKAE